MRNDEFVQSEGEALSQRLSPAECRLSLLDRGQGCPRLGLVPVRSEQTEAVRGGRRLHPAADTELGQDVRAAAAAVERRARGRNRRLGVRRGRPRHGGVAPAAPRRPATMRRPRSKDGAAGPSGRRRRASAPDRHGCGRDRPRPWPDRGSRRSPGAAVAPDLARLRCLAGSARSTAPLRRPHGRCGRAAARPPRPTRPATATDRRATRRRYRSGGPARPTRPTSRGRVAPPQRELGGSRGERRLVLGSTVLTIIAAARRRWSAAGANAPELISTFANLWCRPTGCRASAQVSSATASSQRPRLYSAWAAFAARDTPKSWARPYRVVTSTPSRARSRPSCSRLSGPTSSSERLR